MANTSQYLRESILLLSKLEYENAERKLREGIKSDQKNALLWRYLGDCLVLQGRFPEAREALNTSIRYEPSFKVDEKISTTMSGPFGSTRRDETLDLTEQTARRVAPADNPLAHLANPFTIFPKQREFMMNDIDKQKAAVKEDPTNPAKLKALAELLIRFGDLEGGKKVYGQVLSQNPDDVDSMKSLGFAIFMAGDYREALKFFGQILIHNPEDWESHKSFLLCFGFGKLARWR
jgi:tetratricopeptide (TPR) repeat protein